MANTFTTNFGWTLPQIGADTNAWGLHLNNNLTAQDGTLFAVQGTANGALPKAGGVMTGPVQHSSGSLSAPGMSFAAATNAGFYYVAPGFAAVVGGAAVVIFASNAVSTPAGVSFTFGGPCIFNGVQTFNAAIDIVASTAAAAGVNLSPGVAPTSPQNGDMWCTASGLFIRLGGVTQSVATTGGVLLAANNLSDLPNVAVARTNLGVTPTGVDTTYAYRANNLSDLTNAPAARTNLGLGALALLSTPTFSTAGAFLAGQDMPTPLAAPTTTEVGYMGLPQNAQPGNYTLTLADRGKEVFFTANATCTIPANASVHHVIGATTIISADVGVTVTIAISSDTLRWVPANVTGARTLVGPGMAAITKKKTTEWWIKGDVT